MSSSFTRPDEPPRREAPLARGGPRPPTRATWTARLAVVGTTARHVGVGRLAELMLHPQDSAGRVALREALGAEELVYLATCNRIECYVVLPGVATAAELRGRLSEFYAGRNAELTDDELVATVGEGVIEHLFAVTGSLESLIVGETDITRQVRRAADDAARVGLCCAALLSVFERAAACARQVHTRLAAGRAPRSVATAALEGVRSHLGEEGPGTTVLVGTGETIRGVAQAMAGRRGQRLFVDRSLSAAAALAAEFGGRALSLQRLIAEPLPWIDLLVTATSASETVIPAWTLGPALAARARALARRPLIICDLGVPRDVDPSIDHVQGVQVISIDLLQDLQRSQGGLTDEDLVGARRIARREAQRLLREDRFKRLADEGARSLVAGRLGHLGADDREQVLRFAVSLAGRLARQPCDP